MSEPPRVPQHLTLIELPSTLRAAPTTLLRRLISHNIFRLVSIPGDEVGISTHQKLRLLRSRLTGSCQTV